MGSKAGVAVVKSMQLIKKTTSCLSTVHVCLSVSVLGSKAALQPGLVGSTVKEASAQDRLGQTWRCVSDAVCVHVLLSQSSQCVCSVHFVFSLLLSVYAQSCSPVRHTHYSHTWKMRKRRVSRRKSYDLAPPETLACDWLPTSPCLAQPPSLIP